MRVPFVWARRAAGPTTRPDDRSSELVVWRLQPSLVATDARSACKSRVIQLNITIYLYMYIYIVRHDANCPGDDVHGEVHSHVQEHSGKAGIEGWDISCGHAQP